jgi:pimeloyl-ACP methyl ester carboxylesterase
MLPAVRFVLALPIVLPLAGPAGATANLPGEIEVLGGVSFTHHFAETGATSWHYVEGGNPDGEPVVFLAGLPESWFSFHHQMVALAPTHRVIGIDLFGQTVRPASESFDRVHIAADLVTLTDTIGLAQSNWVSHDWGTVISDALVGLHTDRILRYARLEAPLHVADLALTPQASLFQTLAFTQAFFSNPTFVVNLLYGDAGLSPDIVARLIQELSLTDQVALTAHRLFYDNFPGATAESGLAFITENTAYAAAISVPVLLVQANEDPRQPLYFFDGSQGDPTAVSLYTSAPFAELDVILGSGHFSQLEEPAQVTAALQRLLLVPVPEPGTLSLVGLGGALLARARRPR